MGAGVCGYAVVECAAGVFDFDVFDEAHGEGEVGWEEGKLRVTWMGGIWDVNEQLETAELTDV